MGSISVSASFEAAPDEAERCWLDARAWATWVDGVEDVIEVGADWPEVGSCVVWVSNPAGRGRVTEQVVSRGPGATHTVSVQDPTITGRQTVSFTPAAGGVEVRFALTYRVSRRNPLTPVIDALFIRRAFAASLRRTLERFGTVLAIMTARGSNE